MSAPLICFVTHPVEGATAFAHRLVQSGVAACVNQHPVTSAYRWQGRVEEDAEVLLIVKTARERLAELERLLVDHHPYDVPELIALEPQAVGEAYGRWWQESLQPRSTASDTQADA